MPFKKEKDAKKDLGEAEAEPSENTTGQKKSPATLRLEGIGQTHHYQG